MNISNKTLSLFFTSNTGIKTWKDVGCFDREIQLYKNLSKHLKRINFITYGDRKNEKFKNELRNINILNTKWYKNKYLTTLNIILKDFRDLKNTDILKTNQIKGSEIAVILKKIFRKKLIVRCGYLYSEFMKKKKANREIINRAIKIERSAFKNADLGIVATERDRKYVIENYNVDPNKIKVIPNYVVTDIFKPKTQKKEYYLVYVGRSGYQKNILSLLKALEILKNNNKKVSLLMIGSCNKDETLHKYIKKYDFKVTFAGNIDNFQIPNYLNKCRIFILPSLYEGHPKVLLEAMSCGLPCIGTNVDGIKEEITHLKNGYLCKTNPESIAKAIQELIKNEKLRNKIGRNARKHVLDNYTLDKIVKMELKLYKELLS